MWHVLWRKEYRVWSGKPERYDHLKDLGVNVLMRSGVLLGCYAVSSDNFYTYTTQINEIHSFIN
jgi:hypothetical protein